MSYLVRFIDTEQEKVIDSIEARKDPIPYIMFLQSKIVYEDVTENAKESAKFVVDLPRTASVKVTCE